jgi:HAD superfamily hydrolase (TIGR01490 family)
MMDGASGTGERARTVVPAAQASPRIAIFDLDGTITRSDTFLPFLIGSLWRTPTRWHRTPLLAAAVAMFALRRRDNSWLKAFFLRHIVGGRTRSAVAAYARRHVATTMTRDVLGPARAEIDRLKRAGARLVLATASPDIYVEELARGLGFDDVVCTRVGHDGADMCTGHLDGPNCYGPEKKRRVDAYLADIGAGWDDVAFYSDHHTDLCLLEAARVGYAVNPTPKLARAAAERRLPVLDWTTGGCA